MTSLAAAINPPQTELQQQIQKLQQQLQPAIAEDVGLILPPPELRPLVDKTALYVAQNGLEFETKVLQNKGSNPKFYFLKTENPYHGYFRKMVDEYQQKLKDGTLTEKPVDAAQQQETQQQQQLQSPEHQQHQQTVIQKKADVIVTNKSEKPTFDPLPYKYGITVPRGMAPIDLDIIKLTAQYVACNGRNFLTAIASREMRNPQFDFLKPQHRFYGFFQRLIDLYRLVFNKTQQDVDQVKFLANKQNKLDILDRTFDKAEWETSEHEKKRKQQLDEQKEQDMMNTIDWQDFIVVELIDFDENEALEPVEKPNKYKAKIDAMDVEEAKPVKPSAPIKKDTKQKELMVKDPITGQLMPASQIQEHLRIQLIDPKWKEQKEREQAKFKTTNLASNEEFTNALFDFAKKRTDIIGKDNDTSTTTPSTSADAEQRDERAIWDGHTSSANTTQKAAEKTKQQQSELDIAKIKAQAQAQAAALAQQQFAMMQPPPGFGFPPMFPAPPGMDMGFMPPPPPIPNMALPTSSSYDADEPAAKRPRLTKTSEANLVPEHIWVQNYPQRTISLRLQVPKVEGKESWGLTGDTITLESLDVFTTINDLKEIVFEKLKIPQNKQRFSLEGIGFLKDAQTLASYNLVDGQELSLGTKERAKKKK